jgi:hypothetical protein
MADLSGIPWNEVTRRTDPADRISPHFRLSELTHSETASRLLIDNRFPSVQELRAAVYLCRNLMEVVRDRFGPFTPNSVFRGQELERALKKRRSDWVSKSQHTRGQACDIEIPGLPNHDLALWIQAHLEFDQLILECFNRREGPNSGWVHVSLLPPGAGTNRRDVLSYVMNQSRNQYVYVPGLQETA